VGAHKSRYSLTPQSVAKIVLANNLYSLPASDGFILRDPASLSLIWWWSQIPHDLGTGVKTHDHRQSQHVEPTSSPEAGFAPLSSAGLYTSNSG